MAKMWPKKVPPGKAIGTSDHLLEAEKAGSTSATTPVETRPETGNSIGLPDAQVPSDRSIAREEGRSVSSERRRHSITQRRADLSQLPDDFSGLFLSEEGGLSRVVWVSGDGQDEGHFALKDLSGTTLPFSISTDDPRRAFSRFAWRCPGMEAGDVTLPKLGDGTVVKGRLHFVRLTRIDGHIDSSDLSRALSVVEYATAASASASSLAYKKVLNPTPGQRRSIAPRTVPINVDAFPLISDDNEAVVNALVRLVAEKQKRLNAKFGRDTVRFEFITASGRQDCIGLKDELTRRCQALVAGRNGPSSRSLPQNPLEGFMVTDIEQGVDYHDRRLLVLKDKLRLEGGEGVYLFSSILDLAVTLTVVMDSPSKEEFYPVLADLYEKALQRPLKDKELSFDILFSVDPAKSQEEAKKVPIVPMSRYNLNDLRELYERMSDTLKYA